MISYSTADILHLFSFYPKDSKIVKIVEDNNQVSIYLKSQTHEQICPKCGHDSNRYHSTYRRKLQDQPIFGKSVYIYLTGYQYQYQYENDDCDLNYTEFCIV